MNRQQRRAEKKQRGAASAALPGSHALLADALRHHQSGRLNEAERLYREILAADPRHADALHLLGMVAYQARQYEPAIELIRSAIKLSPKAAFFHSNLGLALGAQGKPDEAVACYRRALDLQPDYVEAHNNLGNALKDLGRPAEAAISYRQAIALKPGLAEAHSNLGNALRMQDMPDEAEACYRRALAIKPDYAEAMSNLGNVLRDQRKLDDAVACYRQAIALKPNIAETHNNLANALRDQGAFDEALACYRKAIALKPDYTGALNNLALLLLEQGQAPIALGVIKISLQIDDAAETRRIFVDCIRDIDFTDDDGAVKAAAVRALTEPWGRPGVLARACAGLLKQDPDVGPCIARAEAAWPRHLSAQELFGPDGPSVLDRHALLGALLCSSPVPDIAVERFLTMARRNLLDAAAGAGDGEATALNFYGALARQCFINEYVYSFDDDEFRKAVDLRERLVTALGDKAKAPALWVLAVAAYFPLSSLPPAARLGETTWPAPVAAVLAQQVSEPEEESRLRAEIPQATKIDDAVSVLVRNQYEENPYPRWVNLEPAGQPRPLTAYLCQKFPLTVSDGNDRGAPVNLLIAGCGTGQHSIGMARKFKTASILAVDLSLASLGYARRKTQELGPDTIDYAQADLLELASTGRQFDAIGSVGVLHHLADLFAGWRALLSILKPGGFMNLGFYSALARRDIGTARGLIAQNGFAATADDIRRCRQFLMGADQWPKLGMAGASIDFFSMSACRDLLFHANEHAMTLTGIDRFIKDNGLTFLGFEIDARVLLAYRRRFPDDPAAADLARWQAFETENPDTFKAMYQFWVRKAG